MDIYGLANMTKGEFISFLRKLKTEESGKSIIRNNLKFILANPNINVFSIMLTGPYHKIFEEAASTNAKLLLRMLVKDNDLYTMNLFSYYYPQILQDNLIILLAGNPSFDLVLYDLKLYLSKMDFSCFNEEIFRLFLTPPKIEDDCFTNRLLALLVFLSNVDAKFIEKYIADIAPILENLIDSALNDHFDIGPDENITVMNMIIKSAQKNDVLNDIVQRKLDLTITIMTCSTIGELTEEGTIDFFRELLKELLVEEDVSIKDIKAFGGSSSSVLLIGEKAFKINLNGIKDIPYDPRVIRPLIRFNLLDEEQYPIMGVEVEDRADTDNITEEDAYTVFKDSLTRGNIFTDCRIYNVGRLKRPNEPHLSQASNIVAGKPFTVEDRAISVTNYGIERITLQEGELVLIDQEDIFSLGDFNINNEIEQLSRAGKSLRYIQKHIYGKVASLLDIDYALPSHLNRYIEEYLKGIETKQFKLSPKNEL